MGRSQSLICQHLRGDDEGARCEVIGMPIRLAQDADIRLCMNGRYEACPYYMLSLHELALAAMRNYGECCGRQD